MPVHESGVNYQNLIRDLAEMYPFDVAEVVIVELVANSLDAKSSSISIEFDERSRLLTVTDNGAGMSASQFDQYHDFAAGLKTRGTGIGFAGVGAKIAFNIADKVVTETRSEAFEGGSSWYLHSKKKLIWEDIEPTHIRGRGSRVEVHFSRETALPFSSTDALISLLRRHYLPLLEPTFLELYGQIGCYPHQLAFTVNGQIVRQQPLEKDFGLERVKKFAPKRASNRVGYGVFGVASADYPLGPEVCGVLISTRGKVIRGELFNQFPGNLGPRLFGLVEVPELVRFLTTNKTDFIRKGKNREFEALYDPIRQEFKAWLVELGVQATDSSNTGEEARLERELKRILSDIPELADFFGFRSPKSVLARAPDGSLQAVAQEGTETTLPVGKGESAGGPGPVDVGTDSGSALVDGKNGGTERANPITRTSHSGPKIGFAEAPDRVDLAWVEGNCVTINTAHPSYIKVRSDNAARRLQNLFAISTAIQRFLQEPKGTETQASAFVDRMMAAWGKR